MNNQIILNYEAEYASQVMNRMPYGYIDKTIPGCGLTTVALEGIRNTIITVPNNSLIHNKLPQYPNDRCAFNLFGVEEGVGEKEITNYLISCQMNNQPIKILVTYDSLYKVSYLLEDESFDLVIDETHKLIKYAKVKVQNKELKQKDVLSLLFEIAYKYKSRTSFISATPVPLQYLPKWISEIPQVKMNWSNTTTAVPYRMQREYPFQALKNEIVSTLLDIGYFTIREDKFKKVIIFLNSVSEINKVLDGLDYNPEDIAYIAGNSAQTAVKLKNLNKLENPSKLPKITFVTSAGYDGIDLYDEEAVSVVVSSASKDFTMTDIATDLRQAISRQRIKSNEHYGKYIFIYNQTIFDKTEEELLVKIDELEASTNSVIKYWNEAVDRNDREYLKAHATFFEDSKKFKEYTIYNENDGKFDINTLIFNTDKYFLLEIRRQYEKGFNMRAALGTSGKFIDDTLIAERLTKCYKDYANYYNKNKSWTEEYTNKDWKEVVETSVKLFKKAKLNYTNAKEDIANYANPSEAITKEIYKNFNIGKDYSRAEVKQFFSNLYSNSNIKRTGKYSDLMEYFEVREKYKGSERYMEILKRK